MLNYCLRCKQKTECSDFVFSKQNSKNKLYIYVGKCSICSGKVSKLSKEKIGEN